MIYNKLNLKVGDKVVIDEGSNNSSEVTIQEFCPNEMFCTVKDDDGASWISMTYRLSPINENKNN